MSLHDWIGVLQLVFASVAGLGALVALIVAYRRQRVAEADSAHDRIRVFNERFIAIASQLGDDQAAVRLAGVHAMAGLADDWEENRQTCVDVLCAYLRMPYEPDPGAGAAAADQLAFGANREVRHTAIRVIGAHLKQGALNSWHGLNLDFTGVHFDGGDFGGARFRRGLINFEGARFSGGIVRFDGAEFSSAWVSFAHAKFSGALVSFARANFCGSAVTFRDAEFSDGEVDFGAARFSAGLVRFVEAEFSGGEVNLIGTEFSGSKVDFGRTKFRGGKVHFSHAEISRGEVNFGGAQFRSGKVNFIGTKFSGGSVNYVDAEFSGGEVNFDAAQFSGGEVYLGRPAKWANPPTFSFTGSPPAGLHLPHWWTP